MFELKGKSMNTYQISEESYKNGYEQGVKDSKAEIERLKKEISITREYIHSHNLEWDLLSYYDRKERTQNE